MKKIFFSIIGFCLMYSSMPNAYAQCFASRSGGDDIMYDYIVYFKHDYPKRDERYFCDNNAPVDENGCCPGAQLMQQNGKDKCCAPDGTYCYDTVFADLATDLTDGTDACARELVNTLNGISIGADTRILLLATTDKTGSHAYNDPLSERRLNLIKQLFKPDVQDKLITHLAGETNDNFTGTTGRNQAERTVRIIVAGAQKIEQIKEELTKQMQVSLARRATVSVDINKSYSSGNRILNAARALDGLTADLSKSRWKTADGNFNGARLASDSIAGVVLGTAGGLITSNVVKKNQIKGGFEDIHCTIGGQVVADFGDEIMVGVK